MIKSMTGFGRAEGTVGDKTFLVEMRSLNGKNLDINLKIPPFIKPYEFDIRSLIQEKLLRGSVECIITLKQVGSARPIVINTDLIKSYYQQMEDVSIELEAGSEGILAALLRLPEVVTPSTEVLDTSEWDGLKSIIRNALNSIDEHRRAEGRALSNELKKRIENIGVQEERIADLEPLRKERLKTALQKSIEENIGNDGYDANRLEQEMIYYIEKLDIREEQVRLRNHCEYFLEVLDNAEETNGRKLSFIIQEMGREINTTGSKANDSEIQKCVVLMKDELEKAKEQTFNIL